MKMKKANLNFNDIDWKNHPTLGEEGVEGRLTIGQYVLLVTAGEGLQSTAGDYGRPNWYYDYKSFEVAVIYLQDEQFTSKFFYGDFYCSVAEVTLGQKDKYRINDLITRIEDSLKTIRVDFNKVDNLIKMTDDFKKVEETIPIENLKAINEIFDARARSNHEQLDKHKVFVEAGWVDGKNIYMDKEHRDEQHSLIIGDTKYIVTIYTTKDCVRVNYLRYDDYTDETPSLKWLSTAPEDAYTSGSYRSRKSGKYTCDYIVGSNRQCSAKGLLKKVTQKNEDSQNSYDTYINQRQAFNSAKDMLLEQYPTAVVDKGYSRQTAEKTFQKIQIVFKSGSSLELDVCGGLLKLVKVEDLRKLSYDSWEGWADHLSVQIKADHLPL